MKVPLLGVPTLMMGGLSSIPRRSYYQEHVEELGEKRKKYYEENKAKENTLRSHSRVPRTSYKRKHHGYDGPSDFACIVIEYNSKVVWDRVFYNDEFDVMEEAKRLGKYRVQLLRNEFQRQCYRVWVWPPECNGADLVCENETEILAIESLNWRPSSYLAPERVRWMKENWDYLETELHSKGSKKRFRRILVCTCESNIRTVIAYLLTMNVEIIYRCPQDIPPSFNLWDEGNA